MDLGNYWSESNEILKREGRSRLMVALDMFAIFLSPKLAATFCSSKFLSKLVISTEPIDRID